MPCSANRRCMSDVIRHQLGSIDFRWTININQVKHASKKDGRAECMAHHCFNLSTSERSVSCSSLSIQSLGKSELVKNWTMESRETSGHGLTEQCSWRRVSIVAYIYRHVRCVCLCCVFSAHAEPRFHMRSCRVCVACCKNEWCSFLFRANTQDLRKARKRSSQAAQTQVQTYLKVQSDSDVCSDWIKIRAMRAVKWKSSCNFCEAVQRHWALNIWNQRINFHRP